MMESGTQKAVLKDEIDLDELAKDIWSKRQFIIKVMSIFFLMGVLIAYTSKVEYKATCKLLPENQNKQLSGGGGLTGLFGLTPPNNIRNQGIPPLLYPEIVKSTPFLYDLIKKPIYFEKEDTVVSSFVYFQELDAPSFLGFLKEHTVGLPGKIRKMFKAKNDRSHSVNNDTLKRYSSEEWDLIKAYSDRLLVATDLKTGITSIEIEMPDPFAAASIASLVVKKLTTQVTDYKIEKAKSYLNFITDQFIRAEQTYKEKQIQLAQYIDHNRNITAATVQTEYARLKNETEIAYSTYKNRASQLEQAKMKVREETPVFTVLEPVTIPEKNSKPKRIIIISIFTITGVIIGLSWTLALLRKATKSKGI